MVSKTKTIDLETVVPYIVKLGSTDTDTDTVKTPRGRTQPVVNKSSSRQLVNSAETGMAYVFTGKQ